MDLKGITELAKSAGTKVGRFYEINRINEGDQLT